MQRTAQCSCGSVKVVAEGEPTCGTSVFWRSNRNPGMTGIAVGAFADPSFPAPIRSVWERSRHAWIEVPVEHHFDKGRLAK